MEEVKIAHINIKSLGQTTNTILFNLIHRPQSVHRDTWLVSLLHQESII